MAEHMTAEQLRAELLKLAEVASQLDPDEYEDAKRADHLDSELRRLAARLSGMAAVPDGWKLVPINATDEMLEAWHAGSLSAVPDGDWRGRPTISANAMYRAGYAALLAAAPEVPGHG